MYLHYFHSFMVHLDGISLLKPIIDHNMYLPSISQSRNNVETWFMHQMRKQALAEQNNPIQSSCSTQLTSNTFFIYPITVPPSEHQLSTACTFSYYKLSTSNTILSSQLGRSLTSPCLLHHTVTLAFGITQDRAELDEYKYDTCKNSMPYTETVQTTVLNDQSFKLTAILSVFYHSIIGADWHHMLPQFLALSLEEV